MDDHDIPNPDELEHLARSLAMDGSVGRHDAQPIADAFRGLAVIERREPSRWNRSCGTQILDRGRPRARR